MLVEFSGLPFSGKSTLSYRLTRRFKALGVPFLDFGQIHRRQPTKMKVPRVVTRSPDRVLLYYEMRFAQAFPAYSAAMAARLSGKPNKDFYHRLMCARFQAALDQGEDTELVLMDEACVTHLTAAHLNDTTHDAALALAETAPLPHAIVHLDVPPELCFRRAVEGTNGEDAEAKAILRRGDLDSFKSRAALMEPVLNRFQARGCDVIRVSGEGDVRAAAETTATRLLSQLRGDKAPLAAQ